ncbi:hypothetical protein GJ744_005020 [Endocarpon pusillum]|uniref:Uncharacterized protein n=1 Tax=Endocarpon pusillum TaxID=364733 RepID=A0A8H7DYL8_9EURO|nr:hypothetical protein GJ744_005020 [Endocarpon pusillum]
MLPGKASRMDNDAKTSGHEQSSANSNGNAHQDKAVDSDTNEPAVALQRKLKVRRAAPGKVVDGNTKKPQGEPQRGPEIRHEGYERPITATNMTPHQDKAADGSAMEPPAEPQASPEILPKVKDYGQPTAATNMNRHHDKTVDGDNKKPRVKPQRWPEIAQDFLTILNIGLNRMLDIFGILGTLFVTLVPLLKVLALFAVINIFRTAFESPCEIPLVPYTFGSYCHSSDDSIQRFNALENMQSRLLHVQELGASGLTLPMQLEYSKNIVREVGGIVEHSKLPSRDEIVYHLTEFWQLADNTIEGISVFLNGIDRMVDSAITRNEITLRNLKNIAFKRAESAGTVSQVFAILLHKPLITENAIRKQYIEHLDRLTAEIDRVLHDSRLQEINLKGMANIQWDIHQVIVGDNNHVTVQEQEIQGRFWTLFGRYKNLLDDYKKQAAVLQQLDEQRKWAVDLISDISGKLMELKSKLVDLRYRIQEPGVNLSGDLNLQIGIIQRSLDNLYAGRSKSRNEKRKTMADIKRQIERERREAGWL